MSKPLLVNALQVPGPVGPDRSTVGIQPLRYVSRDRQRPRPEPTAGRSRGRGRRQPPADQHHRAALTIRERLATADPGNAGYQGDLSVGYIRLGDLAVAAGDTPTADQHYRAALPISERLATADPGHAEYQRDLSVSHNKLGDLAVGR